MTSNKPLMEASINVVRLQSLLNAQLKKHEALCLGENDKLIQDAQVGASALLDSLMDAVREQGRLTLADFRSKGSR